MTRVLYLTPGVFDKGGISRYNRAQLQALRELLGSAQVVALSLLGPAGSSRDLETSFPVDWAGPAPSASYSGRSAFFWQALRFAFRFRPDLVWCAHVNYGFFAHLLARAAGARSVLQVYGREVWTPRRMRPDVSWGLRLSQHLIADCHFTADYVRQTYRPHKQDAVIWDCVDVHRYTPGSPAPAVLRKYRLQDPAHMFNLLTLGRIAPETTYKGYLRLLDVFEKLPDYTRLVFGGGGSLIPELQERVKRSGWEARVTFTGFIDEADLPDIYRAASVFSLVGDRSYGRGEGIPLTPLEAAACGAPILVGNQDGSREAVVHGITGFALDPFDVETIAASASALAGDPALRQRMGAAARQKIEREHSYEVFCARHAEFLDSL